MGRLSAFVLGVSLCAIPAAAQGPPASALDYEMFKTRVQPMFTAKREGLVRCVQCHTRGTGSGFALQPLPPGATTWSEEASRKNFESAQRLVVPGEPTASRLLMHPLARAAGGDPFHGGGKHWASQDEPEWRTLAEWVRSGGPAAAPATTSAAASGLSFDVYRSQVEPILLKPRAANEGSGQTCASCHTTVATRMRLQPLAPGATAWTEEQSRQNFKIVAQLVSPGEPAQSRLLLHPLAVEAGGDPQHTGGKFWPTRDHPEWQALAAWVKTGTAASGAAPAAARTATLDFDVFKTRVQPIFVAKRPGLVRCIQCHARGGGSGFALQPLPPGATMWDEEASRKNFESAVRLVSPGEPTASRLLMHPLARSAGGDPFHGGGKHWATQDAPEWQLLAAWVTGRTAGSSR